MKAILATLALVITTQAEAARCPYGQIYRIRMGVCVSWSSPLARGYVHMARLTTPDKSYYVEITTPPPKDIPLPELTTDFGGDADELTRSRLLLRAILQPKNNP